MKKRLSLVMLFAVVAAQLGWLGYSYHARVVELSTSPTLLVECDAFDPRDIFRGDYVSFDCRFSYPITDPIFDNLLHWNEEIRPRGDEESSVQAWDENNYVQLKSEQIVGIPPRPAAPGNEGHSLPVTYHSGYLSRLNFLAGYWRKGEDGVARLVRVVQADSEDDKPHEGELRTPMSGNLDTRIEKEHDNIWRVKATVRLSMCKSDLSRSTNFRFYVPENMGDARHAWSKGTHGDFPFNRIRSTVEFVLRGRNGLIVKQLYLNGIPWVEAIESMRRGDFPLADEQPKEPAAAPAHIVPLSLR